MGRGTRVFPGKFLSTPSVRRATSGQYTQLSQTVFLSTPSVRRATRAFLHADLRVSHISIHALRAEGDAVAAPVTLPPIPFLSTPSVRRATAADLRAVSRSRNFYPRPPCGGRPTCSRSRQTHPNFYPRPPCGGRPDAVGSYDRWTIFLSTPSVRRATELISFVSPETLFLSTPSVRRATTAWSMPVAARPISIHALRAEGDAAQNPVFCVRRYFYPRPPCGGRPGSSRLTPPTTTFLSTPSVRRATAGRLPL